MNLQAKHNHGMTLLELMIATAVLIIAITGLLAALTGLFTLNENAGKLTLAMTAAQDKIEEIRNANFDTLFSAYNAAHFDPDGFLPSQAEANIVINDTNPDLLQVCVSVSWMGRSNKIIGEDLNLNGGLDAGEDLNGDLRLSSPAEIVTLIGRR